MRVCSCSDGGHPTLETTLGQHDEREAVCWICRLEQLGIRGKTLAELACFVRVLDIEMAVSDCQERCFDIAGLFLHILLRKLLCLAYCRCGKMKPVIGITSSFNWSQGMYALGEAYVESIEKAGGMPLILPSTKEADFEQTISMVDGVLLSGGVDLDPQIYGEQPMPKMGAVDPKRDYQEIQLAKMALEKKRPLLAICRGIQVLNVAAGGTLVQDIYTQVSNPIKHAWYVAGNYEAPPGHPTHSINVEKDSRLFKIFGKQVLEVNSFHHQAVKKTGGDFKATAWTEDGVIEAIEYQGKEFIMGVQWHPERMINGEMIKIFQALVDTATSK